MLALLKSRIRSPDELAFLHSVWPDGQLANLWLNFKVSANNNCNFFNALQNHGWMWEDGTSFTFASNWFSGTPCTCAYSCMFINADEKFTFDSCTNTRQALCEYQLNEKFVPLRPTRARTTAIEFESTLMKPRVRQFNFISPMRFHHRFDGFFISMQVWIR